MNKIRVTTTQNEYLKELADGPKTTRDIVLSRGVRMKSASKVFKKLRDAGLITSTRVKGTQGNINSHELTSPYEELNIVVRNNHRNGGVPVSEEEIQYAAALRKEGLIGQRLINKYHTRFPDRIPKTILNFVIPKARARGLF